ncbi:unnamed protein product [Calicophoron daubneyi]|uniref:Uncharacterized protein n=1 Tax=Calicophoron daubneyi TaxID=300641 RepID=A0AAV2TTE9_CALDB
MKADLYSIVSLSMRILACVLLLASLFYICCYRHMRKKKRNHTTTNYPQQQVFQPPYYNQTQVRNSPPPPPPVSPPQQYPTDYYCPHPPYPDICRQCPGYQADPQMLCPQVYCPPARHPGRPPYSETLSPDYEDEESYDVEPHKSKKKRQKLFVRNH